MITVYQCLINSFIVGNFGLSIAHENIDFDPDFGTPYAEIKVLENDKSGYSVSTSDNTDGILQIILRYPINDGAINIRTKSQLIEDYYKIGKHFTYNNQEVIITGFNEYPGVPEIGWYKLVLSVKYTAFIKRG